MKAPVCRNGCGVDAAQIAHSAAAVVNGVAVQQLTPPTALRNSERVVRSWHGRKVADDENRRAAAWAAQKRDYARLGVVRVDPLEACGLEVDLVQRRLAPIERIERRHPALDARVLGFVGERPV